MEFLKWARYHWDRVGAAVLAALGILTLLLGWVGVSGTVYPAEQLPYMISGGVLGLFFLGGAGVLYISADMRDEWRKLDSIDTTLKELAGTTTLDYGVEEDTAEAQEEPPASEPSDNGKTAARPAARKRTTRTTRQPSGTAS